MTDYESRLIQAARRLPLAERVVHKLWKVRLEAYEEMRSNCEKVLSHEDTLFDDYGTDSAVHQLGRASIV